MALQQSSRTLLLRACMRSKHAAALLTDCLTQQLHQPPATSGFSPPAALLNPHTTVLGQQQLAGGLRSFADAPSPSDPMIIPLRQQPSLQQSQSAGPPDRNKGPWEKVEDQASGASYWWNQKTGVTTPVGAPKPDAWVEVVDKPTGLVYYWNQDSGDTTAVGEPMPGPEGRIITATQALQERRPSAAAVLGNSLAVGFGIGLVFGLIRWIF